uniref:steroid 21-hydroxylase n=1 Tax=Pristiophorus japonicus TaxID=55135 RepID=UPI00398F6317
MIIVLLGIIALLLTLKFRNVGMLQKQRSQRELPGPPSLPIIGNLLDFRKGVLHLHLTRLAKAFGPIYRLRLWSQDIVVLNTTELIKEALVKRSADFAGRPLTFVGNFISFGGKDLALGDYTITWKTQKKLAHSAMQWCRTTTLEAVVVGEAQKLCEDILFTREPTLAQTYLELIRMKANGLSQHISDQVFQSYKGAPVDPTTDLSMSVCNVISSLIFGTTYEKNDDEFQDIHDCILTLVKLFGSPSIDHIEMFPLLQWKDFQQAVDKRDSFVRQQIRRHKETFQKGKLRDVMDVLMKSIWDRDKGTSEFGEITEEHIHMVIVDMFIGGTETVSSTLSWVIAFLIHRPEIQDRIYSEMCEVVGADQYPTYKDKQNLPLLNATIAEILRLCPVLPLSLFHRTTCDTSVAGYFIHKGTDIITNIFAAHQDESKWTEPTHFRPERFLEAADTENRMQNLVPFGAGMRTCLGETVARVELFAFIAHLLKDFHFLPAKVGECPDLHKQHGILLKVKPYRVSMVPRSAHRHE